MPKSIPLPPKGCFLLLLQLLANSHAWTHEGWRIAMSIGREPETNGMPNDWAASGCRIPVVVGCDFRPNQSVVPLTGDVRFTGPDGEVVKPVEQGEWSLSGDQRTLSFTLDFPDTLERRDVTLRGTVRCEGLLYSEGDLKQMNEDFYDARESRWDALDEKLDSDRKATAPKQWNPETNRWEEATDDEGFFSKLGKQVNLLLAERNEAKINSDRPLPKDLSLEAGPFPGIDTGEVYVRKGGTVYLRASGFFGRESVIGTWSAEPINDKPLSYY